MKKLLLQNVRENETVKDISKNLFEDFHCITDNLSSNINHNTFLNKNLPSLNQVGNSFKIENVLNAAIIPSIQTGVPLILIEPKVIKNELITNIDNKIFKKNYVKKIKHNNSQSDELDIQMISGNPVIYNANAMDSIFEQQTSNDNSFLKSNFDPLLTHSSNKNSVKSAKFSNATNPKQINTNAYAENRTTIETNYQYQKSVIRCLICGKLFNNSSALAKHKLTHSDERKYTCSICSKAFKRQDHLNGHMMTHCSKKPFECKFFGCGKSYCDARSLRRHLENHHQDILGNASSNSNVISNNAECNGDMEAKSAQKTDNSASPVWSSGCNPLDEPKPVKCHICNRGFKNLPALNGHMRLHGGYVRRDSDDDTHNEKNTKLVQIKQPIINCEDILNENSNISTASVSLHLDEHSSAKHINNNDQYYINYMKSEYSKIPVNNILGNSNGSMENRYCTDPYYSKNMEMNMNGVNINNHKKSNVFNMPPVIQTNNDHFGFYPKSNYTNADESKYGKKIIHSNHLNEIRHANSEYPNKNFGTDNVIPDNYESSVNYCLMNNVPNKVLPKQLITEVNFKHRSDYVQNIYSAESEHDNTNNTNYQPSFHFKNSKDCENVSEYNLLHRRRALRPGVTASLMSESLNIETLSDSFNSQDSNDISILHKDRMNLSLVNLPEPSSPLCVSKSAVKFNKISTPITPRSPQTASEPHTPAQGIKFQFPPKQDQMETEAVAQVIEANLPEGANINFMVVKNNADVINEVNSSQIPAEQIIMNVIEDSTDNRSHSTAELVNKSGTLNLANESEESSLFLAPGPASRLKKKFKPSPLSLESTNLLIKKYCWFQLKSPRFRDVKKIVGTPPPYTPPPMLSPAQKYFRYNEHYVRVDRSPIKKTRISFNEKLHSPANTHIKPHINIGPNYQCLVPEYKKMNDILCKDISFPDLSSDLLLWSPNDAHQLPEKLMHALMQYPGEESTGGCDEDKERILLLLHIHQGNLKKAVDAFAKDGTNYDLNQKNE